MLLNTVGKEAVLMELDLACMGGGLLRPMPAAFYAQYSQHDLSLWCVTRGIYCLPTTELIEFLGKEIAGKRAIEIGAGNGVIGRALGIPATDSRMQERPEIAEFYASIGQQVVTYGQDVDKLDAAEAIEHYQPEIVIAAWVTHQYDENDHHRGGNAFGIDEEAIAKRATYIHVGHERVHAQKPVLKIPHETHRIPLWSRSFEADENVIWIWRPR